MSQETNQPSSSLVKALRWQLQPLVKLLIKSGITFPFLADLLKGIYVEVAERDFQLEGKEQTDSRINVLTGIHRKDVKSLRNTKSTNEIPTSVSLGAQLVAHWIGSKQFLSDKNTPLPLPRLIKTGGDQSFEALVISVNKDIRSRAVLDQWLDLGIVNIDEQGRVCLNTDAFIPEKGYDEKVWFFGENMHDHMAASVHNMIGDQPAFLDRAVFYDQLTQQSVDELKETAEQSGMRLLRKINQRALELQTADKTTPEKNAQRMRFGIYFFNEEESSTRTDDE